MKFTKEQALRIGKKLRVNFNKYDFEQFKYGLGIEWEHRKTVGGSQTQVGRIVLDHLKEDRNYYIKFKKSGLK
jgi:hypothetical protein